jgi:hypothetical protein
MKQLENNKEAHKVDVGNTDCNMTVDWRSNRYPRKISSQVQTAWLGGAELIPWPPRSPDFTPCNFYLSTALVDLGDFFSFLIV